MNGDNTFARRPRNDAQISEKIQKAFDDIAKYFSKKEWEKMKASEKIIYVYMKINYEVMTKLEFGNLYQQRKILMYSLSVEHPQITSNRLQRIFPKIMPKKPAEKENDSKQVAEASGPRKGGKQPCPPGKPSTSEKINKRSGKRKQFGNNRSGFPGYVQVCGLGVWHGSQTSLGPGWAEELAQLQMRC
uniref:KRAB-related domain-containing protein n=1 Tax=Piliocolobus tephrosceles TaxID=591936 RepID=A0A8C9GHF3_9PRIM